MSSSRVLIAAAVVIAVVAGTGWWLAQTEAQQARQEALRAVAAARVPMSAPEARGRETAPATPDEPLPLEARPAPAPPPATAPSAYDPDDPVGLTLHGAVYDPDGVLLDSGRHGIAWTGSGGTRHGALLAQGVYALAGLRPGVGTLSTEMQGCLPWEREIELMPDVPLRRVDIHLERALTLCVRVVDPAGRPLADALTEEHGVSKWEVPQFGVLATPEPLADLPPFGHRLESGNAHGSYVSRFETWGDRQVQAGCEGMLDLARPLPLWVNLLHRNVVLASQRVEDGAMEVVFVLEPDAVLESFGSVRIQVVDAETDEAVTDAYVDVSNFQVGGGGQPVDAQGVAFFERVEPGLLDLQIRAAGYETVYDVISVGAGEQRDLGRRDLDPATTVRGVVVDADGVPQTASVRFAPADWHHDSVGRIPQVGHSADSEGAFTLTGLGRRPYLVWVPRRDGRGSALTPVDTTVGDVDGVRIVVQDLVDLTLRRPWPEDDTHTVTMLDAAGNALWRAALPGSESTLGYLPGAYTFVVDGASRTATVTLVDTPKELTLPSP